MGNILEYKGYHAKVYFDADSFTLRGKIEGINDYVDFQSYEASQIEQEFHNAVDDYLAFCEEMGKEPEKEYKGTFNVRISPELHKQLAIYASKKDVSLNSVVEKAIHRYISGESQSGIGLQQTIRIISEVLETQPIYNNRQYRTENNANIIPLNSIRNIKMSYQEEVK